MSEVETVRLTTEEQSLFDGICWNLGELMKKDNRSEQFERIADLAELLFARNAIPQVRLSYFTDPKMNIGGHGKSRQQVFEKNGTHGRDILRHPHFLAYLKYFISGPDLPAGTIRGLCKIIEDDCGTSGMVLSQITVAKCCDERTGIYTVPANAHTGISRPSPKEIHRPLLVDLARDRQLREHRAREATTQRDLPYSNSSVFSFLANHPQPEKQLLSQGARDGPHAFAWIYQQQGRFTGETTMGKTMGLAAILIIGTGLFFGMGGLLVTWAIAPVIGAVLWAVAKGMRWM